MEELRKRIDEVRNVGRQVPLSGRLEDVQKSIMVVAESNLLIAQAILELNKR